MRFQTINAVALAAVLATGIVSPACGQGVYTVDPHLSTIEGSIKYTVVGRYVAHFQDFSGTFSFYPDQPEKSSVTLAINTASITSTHPSLDRIVRSRQLLDVKKFPQTNFVSTAIHRSPGGEGNTYQVTGNLTLHGVTREITFPFTVSGPFQGHNNHHLEVQGTWVINRKDFAISWHPLLDQGGIFVGNHMTVRWKIVAFQ